MSDVDVGIGGHDNTGPALNSAAGRFAQFAGRVKAVIGGNLITGAFSKVGGLIKDAANRMGELVDTSDELGVSVETLDKLGRIFKGAGVEIEETRKALRGLQDQQALVKNGNDDAAAKFAKLGLSMSEVKKLGIEELFFRVADGLAGMDDASEAAATQMDLMGSKSAKMLSTLKSGGNALKEAMKEVAGAITEDTARAADNASDEYEDMWSRIGGTLSENIGKIWREYKQAARMTRFFSHGDLALPGSDFETTPEIKTPEGKTEAEVKKQAFESSRRAAEKEIATKKEAKALVEEIAKSDERVAKASEDERKAKFDILALDGKRLALMERLADAVNRTFDGSPIERARAVGDVAELKAQLSGLNQEKAERLGLPAAERKAAEDAEKKTGRQRKRGARIMREKESDAIDQALAKKEITPEIADARKAAAGIALTRGQIDRMQQSGEITLGRATELRNQLARGVERKEAEKAIRNWTPKKQAEAENARTNRAYSDLNEIASAVKGLRDKIGIA